jgi:hypothetical protein
MNPTKAYLTAGRTFWYVPLREKGSLFATNYLHDDGVIRFGCQNNQDGRMSGHYPTRAKAREAIKLHKRLKTERTAEVFAHDGNGGIKFNVTGRDGFTMTGSEPYGEFAGRDFSHAMIAVGMILQKFGVKDFKFHWRKGS